MGYRDATMGKDFDQEAEFSDYKDFRTVHTDRIAGYTTKGPHGAEVETPYPWITEANRRFRYCRIKTGKDDQPKGEQPKGKGA